MRARRRSRKTWCSSTSEGRTITSPSEPPAARAIEEDAVFDALVLGVRDYASRCGIRGAVLGVSGGIDSAVVASLACRALGAENVLGLALPTRNSSPESVEDAERLARALGMRLDVVPIEDAFRAHEALLEPVLATLPQCANDVTFENVQARIRMIVLMAVANRAGALLLATGNKSEVATGYCTLYGDMAGGLAPIADVYKTQVYALADTVQARMASPIPERTIAKAPSAELRPGQLDADTLPPYGVLDAVLERLIEGRRSSAEIAAEGFDATTVTEVARMVASAEHKRRQMPPLLVVTSKAFGPGRRVPIANRYGL